MLQFKGKLTVFAVVIGLIFNNSFALANQTCAVAASSKIQIETQNSLEEYFGESAWEVRLAAAELLHKYSSTQKRSNKLEILQLDPRTHLLLSAIVSGHLNTAQFALLDSYKDYLENAVRISTLISRVKLSEVDSDETPAPKVVSDSLVTVKLDKPTAGSSISNLMSKLNPISYFNKDGFKQKKYGPVSPYFYTDLIIEDLRKFAKSEKLEVLKYKLASVEMLTPKEIIRLLREVPIDSQLAALEFLDSKRVGRYDFYPETSVGDAQAYLRPEVLLMIISTGGDNWPIQSILNIIKDNLLITSDIFGTLLSRNYSPEQIRAYLNTQSFISLREAELLLDLMLPNAQNETERKKYYSELSEKLNLASDKKILEELFVKRQIKKLDVAQDEKKPSENKAVNGQGNKVNEKISTFIQGHETIAIAAILSLGLYVGNTGIDYISNYFQHGNSVQIEQTQGLKIGSANQNKGFSDIGKISNEEFNQLKYQTDDNSMIRELIIARMNSGAVKTANDFVEALHIIRKSNGFYTKLTAPEEISSLWKIYAKKFIELNPTNEEFNIAKEYTYDADVIIELIKARLEYGKLNSADDVVETFKPVPEANEGYTTPEPEELDKLKRQYYGLDPK